MRNLSKKCWYPTMVVLVALSACGKVKPQSSAIQDVTLRNSDGSRAVVYRDASSVKYRICVSGTAPVNRSCANPLGERSLGITVYAAELQKNVGVRDPQFLGLDALSKIQEEIKFVEPATSDPTLEPGELDRAQQRLWYLKDIELTLLKADSVLKYLELGKDITFSSTFSDLFGAITSPFARPVAIPDWSVQNPVDGTVWVRLGARNYFDAADLNRTTICSSNPAIRSGCVSTYGAAWSLPTRRQVLDLATREDGLELLTGHKRFTHARDDIWLLDGDRLPYGLNERYPNIEPNSPDSFCIKVEAFCFAKASVVDPNGDVDGDGIFNKNDKCNALPERLNAPVHMDGRFRGCAEGQIPNNN